MKNFKNNPIGKNISFLEGIKMNLQDYAAKVFADPTGDYKYEIPEEDLEKLRNNYLHYDATATFVNKPEPNRKRGEVTP